MAEAVIRGLNQNIPPNSQLDIFVCVLQGVKEKYTDAQIELRLVDSRYTIRVPIGTGIDWIDVDAHDLIVAILRTGYLIVPEMRPSP